MAVQPIVLSESISPVLDGIEMALEVWFGKPARLIDATLEPGLIFTQDGCHKRRVKTKARFALAGREQAVVVRSSLVVKKTDCQVWLIEGSRTVLMIDGDSYLVVWDEPQSDDLFNVRVSSDRGQTWWAGYSPQEGERWQEPKQKDEVKNAKA